MKEAFIKDVMLDGRGVADVDGKKVFVPYVITGEKVRFETRKKKKKYDEAKLLDIVIASEQRILPRCQYFGICGGCATQHISMQSQIELKQQSVLQTLLHIGHVVPEKVLPPVVDSVWGYRRRARLAVKSVAKKGRVLVGFREKSAPYVTDMTSCEVLHPHIGTLIEPLSRMIGELTIHNKIPQVECSVADNITALVFRVLEEPGENDIQRLALFAKYFSVRVYLQPKGLDSIYHLQIDDQHDNANQALRYSFSSFGISLEFSPVDFVQVHAGINQKMITLAHDWLALSASSSVLDLFCGLGNFSLPFATRFARVLGVEGDAALIERARHNAKLNQLSNISFEQADLFAQDHDYKWIEQPWDAVVLDPPRSGAKEIIERFSSRLPEKVLYVSCHPATLARDADVLVNTLGYKLTKLCVLNMFPQTGHVETMAMFNKANT